MGLNTWAAFTGTDADAMVAGDVASVHQVFTGPVAGDALLVGAGALLVNQAAVSAILVITLPTAGPMTNPMFAGR